MGTITCCELRTLMTHLATKYRGHQARWYCVEVVLFMAIIDVKDKQTSGSIRPFAYNNKTLPVNKGSFIVVLNISEYWVRLVAEDS